MKFPPNEKQLLQLLHESGLRVPDQKLSLQEHPRNRERSDHTERRNYILHAGTDIIGFLTAGQNLHQLAERIELFHRAYPSFGTRILGHTKTPAGELLLQEHFAGQPASQCLGQPAGTEKIRSVLEKISLAFNAAQHTSTPEAAQAELHAFLNQVAALPHWKPVDKTFLLEVVRPYLETHLLSDASWTRRVSNGDFLLRNLLINSAGEFRLVDCEFATDTHFHAEDWLRLTYWDALPQSLRTMVEPHLRLRNPWTVFFGLKQLLLENRIKVPPKAQETAGHWCREIRQIVEHSDEATRTSCFWPSSGQTESQISTEVRLYWLAERGWNDTDSIGLLIDAGRPVQLIFEIPAEAVVHGLRLDPMNAPGIATIHSLRVVLPEKGDQVLWAGEDSTTLQHLVPAGDSLCDMDPTSGAFRVISLENDPQLYLNGVGKVSGQSLQVRAIITFSTDPLDQIAPIRRYVQLLLKQHKRTQDAAQSTDARLSVITTQLESFAEVTKAGLGINANGESPKAQLERFDAHLKTLAGQLGSFAEASKDSLTKIAEDGATKAQLESLSAQLATLAEGIQQNEKLKQELRETRKSLLLLQATMPERDRQLSLAREALQGHARTIDRLEQSRDQLEQSLQTSQASVGTLMESIRASEDQNGRLAQELAAARERVESFVQQVQQLEIRESRLQAELVAMSASLESSRLKEAQATARTEAALGELGRATASIANQEKLLLQLGEQLALAIADGRTLSANYTEEKQLRLKLEQTRSWRWTAWIRNLDAQCRRFYESR